jgi:hypothetical protein
VKLYHFTTREHIRGGISKDGLRAYPLVMGYSQAGIKPQRGVWLTECESTSITPEERLAHFMATGEWINHWLLDRATDVFRLTVEIGDHDKRLIKPETDQLLPHLSRVTQAHRCYLRAIPFNKLVDVQPEERPDLVSPYNSYARVCELGLIEEPAYAPL